ncbi:Cys-tRNA(Pro) deacylase [Paracraurococcus ruber]|uniref:Cys-tRNA(Pro)/Cys-tRNA(Cys) deacylase n=1 Tax=Paracraurococcus ruber TaxID=77675 RepID=A0ABS1CV16_9PROT|nr:Cys-tRNA(Pro) deacylase [Paracraurococcus ruber]MBK1658332.1 Cys-tRNA(Pro) deacylase [Paracraurococcus ruber]TDG29921.1 Cys-tRNA(Pro) deacylase [Paracraurococcus ruber]
MPSRKTPAVRAAEAAGLDFRLLEYDYDPDADSVGLQAAAAMGIPAARVFKTLVCVLDGGEMVCAAIPSDARLSLKALAVAAGAKRAEMSDPAKAERSTGYVVGGISPFGQRKRLRCFLDASAATHAEIVVNGGRRGLQMAAAPGAVAAALEAVLCPLQSE